MIVKVAHDKMLGLMPHYITNKATFLLCFCQDSHLYFCLPLVALDDNDPIRPLVLYLVNLLSLLLPGACTTHLVVVRVIRPLLRPRQRTPIIRLLFLSHPDSTIWQHGPRRPRQNEDRVGGARDTAWSTPVLVRGCPLFPWPFCSWKRSCSGYPSDVPRGWSVSLPSTLAPLPSLYDVFLNGLS